MDRRPFIKLGVFGLFAINAKFSPADEGYQFSFSKSKQGYLNRIQSIKKSGILPIIDVESSYNPSNFDLENFVAPWTGWASHNLAYPLIPPEADQPGVTKVISWQ